MPSRKIRNETDGGRRLFRALCADVSRVFPYFVAAYAAAFALSFSESAANAYVSWPAFHVVMLALGAMDLAHRVRDDEFRKRLFDAVRKARTEPVAPETIVQLAKYAVSAGAVLWAVSGGADVVELLILVFGILAVVYGAVHERWAYVLAASWLLAVPIALAIGWIGTGERLAVYAFETLLVVAAQLTKQISTEKS